jgi:beta-ureidopropionase / N-carbamoyl-L-amino-acid hydrolase
MFGIWLMLHVDRARLAARLSEMAMVGATGRGGVHRLALSDADRQARDLLDAWCRQKGFSLEVDTVGNMFASRTGRSSEAPPLLIGSHLDSQPNAGAYDGPVGVLCALEVLESLDDLDVETRQPVQVVNWTNEEGARFRPPLLASGVFAGIYDAEFALNCRDVEGIRFGDELQRIGYAGPRQPGWPISGYIEVHIEQGTVLEATGAVVGVVTGVVGIRDLQVTVVGEDTHAGPLDMRSRRDALLGAAEMIVAANALGLEHAPDSRVTVGRIAVPSDSHSVVPGLAEFTLDLRHPESNGLDSLEKAARERFQRIAHDRNLELRFKQMFEYPPVAFDISLRDEIRSAALGLGHPALDLPSRAGHDAWNMARVAPAAMIFIPCRDGISHNEREFAEFEHIVAAADVLLNTVASVTKSR